METRAARNFQKTPPSVKADILSVNIPPEYEFTSKGKQSIEKQVLQLAEEYAPHGYRNYIMAIAYVAYKYGFSNGHQSTIDGSFAAYQEFVRLAIEEPGEE